MLFERQVKRIQWEKEFRCITNLENRRRERLISFISMKETTIWCAQSKFLINEQPQRSRSRYNNYRISAAIVKCTACTEVNRLFERNMWDIPSIYIRLLQLTAHGFASTPLAGTFEIQRFNRKQKLRENNSTWKLGMETFLPQLCMLAFECGFSGIRHRRSDCNCGKHQPNHELFLNNI